MPADPNILKRIAGLLALSEDKAASPNEIAVAARIAQRLMTEHQLTRADVTSDGSDGIGLNDDPLVNARRIPTWLMGLANVISQHNGCFTVVYKDDATGKKCLILIGRAEDVDMVRQLFRYLRREIDRVAVAYKRAGHFISRGEQSRFRIGCVTAIGAALREARRQAMVGASSNAIVQLNRGYEESISWAKANLPGLETFDKEVNIRGDLAYVAGYEEGSRMDIGGRGGMETRRLKR